MSQKTWAGDTPYSKLERNLKRLGRTMLASAVYDVLLALAVLLSPPWLAGLMGIDVSRYSPHFALIHLVFPCFCVLAWMDTKRNIVIVTGAILARVAYACFLWVSVLAFGAHSTWAVVGGISLAWAAGYYVFLRLSDFGFWEVLSRAGNPPGVRRR